MTAQSSASPTQQVLYLDALVGAVSAAQGSAGGSLVGSSTPATVDRRGLSVVNTAALTLGAGSTAVTFLQGTTPLFTVPLVGFPVAEGVVFALTDR